MASQNPWKFATLILAILLVISFFVPRDLLRPWEPQEPSRQPSAVVGTDPPIPLAIINDPGCALCATGEFEQNIKTFFPTLEIQQVDVHSAAGKILVERFDLAVVPALLFDSVIEQAAYYGQIREGLEKKDGVYLVRPEMTGSGKLIFLPNILPDDASKGSTNAPLVMFEFSDFQCPFCKSFVDNVYPALNKDYIETGKVRFIFRHLPLDIHEFAAGAALASACAQEQGKFWEYHDTLFKNQDALDLDSLKKYAANIGLDTKKFDDCYNNLKYARRIANDVTYANSIGISGTPSFIINGFIVSGAQPYEVFKSLLDVELEAVS